MTKFHSRTQRIFDQFKATIMNLLFLSLLLSMIFVTSTATPIDNLESNELIQNDEDNRSTDNLEGLTDGGTLGAFAATTGAPSVNECTDRALTYIGCDDWLGSIPNNGAYDDIVIIIDDGLSVNQWDTLESNLDDSGKANVDIIRYYTVDENGNEQVYGTHDIDNVNAIGDGITNTELGYNYPATNGHGFRVTNIFSQIARGAHVIFFDVDVGDDRGYSGVDQNTQMWDKILGIYNNFNVPVKLISMSWFSGSYSSATQDVKDRITQLYNNNIFMSAGMGNNGQDTSGRFPLAHPNVYAVGSIDHESRGKCIERYWWGGCKTYDTTYYSVKNHFSGSSTEASENKADCENPNKQPFCSSYSGDAGDTTSEANSMDFVMPGHRVPAKINIDYGYWWGTSYSTPYFSAAVLVANYAYTQGYIDKSGSSPAEISVNKLYSILKDTATHSQANEFDYRYGWGYVNVYNVYNNAYDQGYTDGPYPPDGCNPDGTICIIE